MKYAVIVTYAGQKTGAVVEADCREQAWSQIWKIFNPEYVQSAELAEILLEDRVA